MDWVAQQDFIPDNAWFEGLTYVGEWGFPISCTDQRWGSKVYGWNRHMVSFAFFVELGPFVSRVDANRYMACTYIVALSDERSRLLVQCGQDWCDVM